MSLRVGANEKDEKKEREKNSLFLGRKKEKGNS